MNERLGHEDVSTLQREGGKRTWVVVQRASIVASGEPKPIGEVFIHDVGDNCEVLADSERRNRIIERSPLTSTTSWQSQTTKCRNQRLL